MGLNDMALFYAEHMHGLKKLMRIPHRRPVRVQLIDDDELAIAGLRTLLGHWNNMSLLVTVQSGGKMPFLDLESDIILIDDKLDGLTGRDVLEKLRDKNYFRLVAALGHTNFGGHNIRYHFAEKERIGLDLPITNDAIGFMNEMIAEIVRVWKD